MLRDLQLEELEDHGLIGSGSSGLVRRVRHTPTGRHLVLKVPPAHPPARPSARLPRLTASLALVRALSRRAGESCWSSCRGALLEVQACAMRLGLCLIVANCPEPATHRCNSSAPGLGHISSCQTGRLVMLLLEKRTPESPLWNPCRLCTLSRRWGKGLGTRCLCIPHFPGWMRHAPLFLRTVRAGWAGSCALCRGCPGRRPPTASSLPGVLLFLD